MSDLWNECIPYFEPKTGAMSLWPNPKDNSTDNGPLFSATLITLLALRDELTIDHREWFLKIADSCRVPGHPGLYQRHPDNPDQEAFDNYLGLATGYYHLGEYSRVTEIIDYGKSHFWTWNNVNPGSFEKRAFFGRYPDFMPFLRACGGPRMGFLDSFRLAAGLLHGTLEESSGTSGRCMSFLRQSVLHDSSGPILKWAIKKWREDINQRYGDGMKGVYRIYFGPDHPFTKHAPGRFE